jgi:hypothetical protein
MRILQLAQLMSNAAAGEMRSFARYSKAPDWTVVLYRSPAVSSVGS